MTNCAEEELVEGKVPLELTTLELIETGMSFTHFKLGEFSLK